MHNILIEVGECSFKEYARAKAVYRWWRNILEEDHYYQGVDLFEMQIQSRYYPGFNDFKVLCLQNRNLSTMYMLGLSEMFRIGNTEEGIRLIWQSAEEGYDLAIYAKACIERMINQSEEYDGEISKEFALQCRRKLQKDETHMWVYDIPQWFVELRDKINIGSVTKCNCTPYNWWKCRKGKNACIGCFWIEQMFYFANEVPEHVRVWPN